MLLANSTEAKEPIKILATSAVQGPLTRLQQGISARVGSPIDIQFGSTSTLVERIVGGEKTDLVLLTIEAIDQLPLRDRLSSPTTLVASPIGLAVSDNAVLPVLKSNEDLIEYLKRTPSVAYTSKGASGAFFVQLIENLGIADIVKSKSVVIASGYTVPLVRDGKAAAAVQMVSELKFAGAKNVVPLPSTAQKLTVLAVAATSSTDNAESVKKIVEYLQTPAAKAAYIEAGLEPLFNAGS
jgi:molybdate transport system substrate-binding protein